MQLLFDFLPVIAFFVAYQLADIYVATIVIVVAAVIQVSVHWLRTRRINPMHLVSTGLVLVFGGLTLAIRDAIFIMWKPTVVNWLFAVAFLASHARWFGGRPLVQRLMSSGEASLQLSAERWKRLNLMWVAFFTVMGAANVAAFSYLDEAAWVKFKFFGMLGLTFLFIVAQGFWIAAQTRHDGTAAG